MIQIVVIATRLSDGFDVNLTICESKLGVFFHNTAQCGKLRNLLFLDLKTWGAKLRKKNTIFS